jgi:competence protein ComEC
LQDSLLRSPLLLAAASFAGGILLARPERAFVSNLPLLVGASCAVFFLGLIALRASWERAATACLLLSFVSAGAATAQLFEKRFPPSHVRHATGWGADLADPVRLEGRLISSPLRAGNDLQFDLAVSGMESRGLKHSTRGKVRLRLLVGDDAESLELADSLRLEYGDTIRVLARLRRPRIYRNPGSFDFQRWLESVEDITYVGTIKSPHLIEKSPGGAALTLAKSSGVIRRRLLAGIDRLYPPWSIEGRNGAVLKAVLLGDRTSLDSATVENFRRTGLYHQLVVSGLQLGLLAFLVGSLLRLLRLREGVQIAGLLAAMVAYALLLEQRAPTLRATLMIFVYLGARFLYRDRSLLNAIGVSALLLLLARPLWIIESGFQLSFAAALLIAALAVPVLDRTTEPLRRALRHLHDADLDVALSPRLAQLRLDLRWLAGNLRLPFVSRHPKASALLVTAPLEIALWTANVLLFSAILQIGLLLPMAETFHRVTLAGILLNAIATPLMTLLLGLAAPTVMLGATVPWLAALPAKILSLVTGAFVATAEFHGLPAWVSYRVPSPPLWVSLGFGLSIVLAAWALGRSRRLFWVWLIGAGVFAALISSHPFSPRLPRGGLEVTVLDCGGGDAIFIVLPDRTTLLVDACGSRLASANEGTFTGSRWDPGESIVSPYLWFRGITQIDRVVLSHAHQDHLGGMTAIFRNFRVGEFWHGVNPPTPAYFGLLQEADRLGIPDKQLVAGQKIDLGGAAIDILWPPAARRVGERPSNDDSLVMRIVTEGGSALLAGDITAAVEEELVQGGVLLRSEVLKVAHHGSRTSSSPGFLARVAPSVALITAEVGNPSPETLARLGAAGARIYRTDVDGAVKAQLRGGQLAVQAHVGSRGE